MEARFFVSCQHETFFIQDTMKSKCFQLPSLYLFVLIPFGEDVTNQNWSGSVVSCWLHKFLSSHYFICVFQYVCMRMCTYTCRYNSFEWILPASKAFIWLSWNKLFGTRAALAGNDKIFLKCYQFLIDNIWFQSIYQQKNNPIYWLFSKNKVWKKLLREKKRKVNSVSFTFSLSSCLSYMYTRKHNILISLQYRWT